MYLEDTRRTCKLTQADACTLACSDWLLRRRYPFNGTSKEFRCIKIPFEALIKKLRHIKTHRPEEFVRKILPIQ